MLVQVLPPSVDLKIRLVRRAGSHRRLRSSGNVNSPAASHIAGDLHIADERRLRGYLSGLATSLRCRWRSYTKMFALPVLKSFQETYIRPKKGEAGLLSAQPDSRSSPTRRCERRNGSSYSGPQGVVDL